jgi:TP901 family phage tail tape measure protein
MATESVKTIITAEDRASAVFGKVGANAKSAFGGIGSVAKTAGIALGGVALIAGGALAAGAVKAVSAFSSFETAMSNVGSLVDTTKESIGEMGSDIIALSKEVPIGAEELATSLYDIRSAGISAAGAMDTLKAAAVLGEVGLSSTSEATDLLTSAINAFGLDAEKAGDAANTIFKTVQAGKTTVADLTRSFGQVAPVANAAGVSFEELQAATAALTTAGIGTSEAQNGLKAALSNVIKPGSDAAKTAKSLGLEFNTGAIKAKGFAGFMEDVKDKTGGNIDVMAKLFGSVEGLNVMLALTGGQSETFKDTLADLGNGVDVLSGKFDEKTDTIGNKWQMLKNTLNANLIESGGAMSQSVSGFLDFANDALPAVLDGLGGAFTAAIGYAQQFIAPLQAFFVDNKDEFLGFFTELKTSFQESFGQLATIGQDVFGGLVELFNDNKDQILSTIKSIGSTVSSVFGVVVGVVKMLKAAWDSDFMGITTNIKTTIATLQYFGRIGLEVFGLVADTLSILFNNWEFYWAKMRLTVFDATNDMIGGIESFINKAISAFNAVSGLIGFDAVANVSLGRIDTTLDQAKVDTLAPTQTIGEAAAIRSNNMSGAAETFINELAAIEKEKATREAASAQRDADIIAQARAQQVSGTLESRQATIQNIYNQQISDEATAEMVATKQAEKQRLDLASLGVNIN